MPKTLNVLAIVAIAFSALCALFAVTPAGDWTVYLVKVVGIVAALFAGGCGVVMITRG